MSSGLALERYRLLERVRGYRSGYRLVALLSALAGGLVLWLVLEPRYVLQRFLATLLLLSGAFILGQAARLGGGFDLFAPATIVVGFWGVIYPLRAVFLVLSGNAASAPFVDPGLILDGMVLALALTIVALWLFYLSYRQVMGAAELRRLSRIGLLQRPAEAVSPARLALVYLAGLSVLPLLAEQGAFYHIGRAQNYGSDGVASQWANLLTLVSNLRLGVLYWWALRACRSRQTGDWFLVGVSIGLELVIGALTGSRQAAILPLLAVLLAMNYQTDRWPIYRRLLAVSWLLPLVLMPLLRLYREIYGQAYGYSSFSVPQTLAALAQAAGQLLEGYRAHGLREVLAQTFNRLIFLDCFVLVVRWVGVYIPYQMGRTYWLAVVALVPRVLWPGKPVISLGSWFAQDFWYSGANIFNNVPITALGEGYANWGIMGALVAAVAFGAGTALVYRVLILDTRGSPVGVALYLALLPSLLSMESNTGQNLAAALMGLAVAIVVTRFLLCERRRSPAGPLDS